jgi:cytochrome c oxidase subunit III
MSKNFLSSKAEQSYYLPKPSHWPLLGCFALIFLTVGGANWLHANSFGPVLVGIGALLVIALLYGWFGTVIKENRAGLLSSHQMEKSFRYGMLWFIFSEVMFFGAFFGALFYTRLISLPLLGSNSELSMTHLVLWPGFHAIWPLLKNPDPSLYHAPASVMPIWGIPAMNTLILLSSGVTITIAHWAIIKEKRVMMLLSQLATIALGVIFLGMQAHEYMEAYLEHGLTLASGIYGTTFFMLTGFHALHVTIGTICLMVIFYRMFKRDFSEHNHFAFAAVSWYWHFVDVVWLLLFVIVYWWT